MRILIALILTLPLFGQIKINPITGLPDLVGGGAGSGGSPTSQTTFCRSTTGNDTYTCGLTPALTSYGSGTSASPGACVVLNADTANTGTATINIDGLGAKNILNRSGEALVTGDLIVNAPIWICYNGTSFYVSGDGRGTNSTSILFTVPNSCLSTTGNDTYTCSLAPLALTSYLNGSCLILNADTSNTGAATINVDGLGAKSILSKNGNALRNNDIKNGVPNTICYNGTNYYVQGDGQGTTSTYIAPEDTSKLCTDAGGDDTYVCSLSPLAMTTYTTGACIILKVTTANTGAATVNVDGLGAITIVDHDLATLANGMIPANSPTAACYNGTNYVLTSLVASSGTGSIEEGTYSTAACTANTLRLNTNGPMFQFCSGSTWKNYRVASAGPMTIPTASQYTVADGTGQTMTLANSTAGLYFTTTGSSDNTSIAYFTAPATPYTFTINWGDESTKGSSTDGTLRGIGFSDNSNKVKAFYSYIREGTSSLWDVQCAITYLSDLNTYSTTATLTSNCFSAVPIKWLRVTDNGTNRLFYSSLDGVNWLQHYSEGNTTDLTTTRLVIIANGLSDATKVNRFTVHSVIVN